MHLLLAQMESSLQRLVGSSASGMTASVMQMETSRRKVQPASSKPAVETCLQ